MASNARRSDPTASQGVAPARRRCRLQLRFAYRRSGEVAEGSAEVLHESEVPRTLVAKDAELGRATLESWLSGLRNPSQESVAQIASALEKRAERLQRLAAKLRKLLHETE